VEGSCELARLGPPIVFKGKDRKKTEGIMKKRRGLGPILKGTVALSQSPVRPKKGKGPESAKGRDRNACTSPFVGGKRKTKDNLAKDFKKKESKT